MLGVGSWVFDDGEEDLKPNTQNLTPGEAVGRGGYIPGNGSSLFHTSCVIFQEMSAGEEKRWPTGLRPRYVSNGPNRRRKISWCQA